MNAARAVSARVGASGGGAPGGRSAPISSSASASSTELPAGSTVNAPSAAVNASSTFGSELADEEPIEWDLLESTAQSLDESAELNAAIADAAVPNGLAAASGTAPSHAPPLTPTPLSPHTHPHSELSESGAHSLDESADFVASGEFAVGLGASTSGSLVGER